MTKESLPYKPSKRTPQERVVHYARVCTDSRLPQADGVFTPNRSPQVDYRACRPTESAAEDCLPSLPLPTMEISDDSKYLNTKATLREVRLRLHRIIADRQSQPTAPITITAHELVLIHDKFLLIGQHSAELRWVKLMTSAGVVAELSTQLSKLLSEQGYNDKVLIDQLQFSPEALSAIGLR